MKRAAIILILLTPIFCQAQITIGARFGIATPLGDAYADTPKEFDYPNCLSLHILTEKQLPKNWAVGAEIGYVGRDQSQKINAYNNCLAQGDTFTFIRSVHAITLVITTSYTINLNQHLSLSPTIGAGFITNRLSWENPNHIWWYNPYWYNNIYFKAVLALTLERRYILSISTFNREGDWFLNTEVGIKIL